MARSTQTSKEPVDNVVDFTPPAPPPFRMEAKTEWIVCDEPGFEGFRIKVRTSITNAEQRVLNEKNDYIVEDFATTYMENIKELIEKEKFDEIDALTTPTQMQRALVAPYVLEWNAQGLDLSDNEWKDIPPPVQLGPEAFDYILDEATSWIMQIVLFGYLATGKARKSLNRSRDTGDTPSPEEVDSDSTPSSLPKNSSEPSE